MYIWNLHLKGSSWKTQSVTWILKSLSGSQRQIVPGCGVGSTSGNSSTLIRHIRSRSTSASPLRLTAVSPPCPGSVYSAGAQFYFIDFSSQKHHNSQKTTEHTFLKLPPITASRSSKLIEELIHIFLDTNNEEGGAEKRGQNTILSPRRGSVWGSLRGRKCNAQATALAGPPIRDIQLLAWRPHLNSLNTDINHFR